MFHQSLDGCADFPSIYILNETERALYCDLEFFKLIKIVMVCDSESYSFRGDQSKMLAYRQEFFDNNTRMVKNWIDFWKK